MSRRIYNIPAEMAFSDVLARVLLGRYRHQPLQLSDVQIFLPTRRAVRNLSDSFLRQSQGKALLLPRFHTLGDLDDDDLIGAESDTTSPALMALSDERTPWNDAHRILVAMKMLAPVQLGEQALSHDQQLSLAKALLQLLDQTETESLEIADLKRLIDDRELAEHWEKSLQFLALLADVWPELETNWGKISHARLRRIKAEAQIELWRQRPPSGPVIVAGTTASIPATRDLLLAIADLPNSEILLPGLDPLAAASRATWSLIGKDPTHPQYGLHQLCRALRVDATAVSVWPSANAEVTDPDIEARVALAQWSALPPEATQPANPEDFGHEGWRNMPPLDEVGEQERSARLARALSNIELVEAQDQNHEAKVIALILRDCLETPSQTAALVTPNRDLARMVAAQMRRWDLDIDDSAGTPLDKSTPALLIRSLLDVASDGCPPSSLLDLLKNPLVDTLAPNAVTTLERLALRGPQPGVGLAGIHQRLRQAMEQIRHGDEDKDQKIAAIEDSLRLVETLRGIIEPLTNLADGSALKEYSETLCTVAEQLVTPERLWAGDEGEALARLFAGLHEDEETASTLTLPSLHLFRNYIGMLMNKETIRLPFGAHPRISVLGTLEARLLNVDHVILGGLNEDSFPANSEPGPWLSRQMRAQFGLPSLERKVGLAAHDFVQSMGNRRISLTRSVKEAGAQTTPSRFLRRFDSYLRQLEISLNLPLRHIYRQPIDATKPWRQWAEELDRPLDSKRGRMAEAFATAQPAKRPAPNPPLSRRPRRFSVSEIEAWRANPYGLYAKRILRLRAWDPVEAAADVRIRGTLIHAAAEAFVRAKEAVRTDPTIAIGTPETDLAYYLESVRAEMDNLQLAPALRILWASRIRHAGEWFIGEDARRRFSGMNRVQVEFEGGINIPLANGKGQAQVTARADRLEHYQNGALSIVDYKTGTPPSARDVFTGIKPQLTIEALIFAKRPLEDQDIAIEYWAMGGGREPGKAIQLSPPKTMSMDLTEALIDIEERLRDMLEYGLGKPTAFVATAAGWGDYHHLSRLQEWSGLDATIQNQLTRPRDSE